MVEIITMRNKRNENKYIEIHHWSDGHYGARQYMKWSNGVRNPTGISTHRDYLRRIHKKTVDMLKEDYEVVK